MSSRTISDYLADEAVDLNPASLDECSRIGIAFHHRVGWHKAPESMFPHAAAVYFDDANKVDKFAPNLVVLVGSLSRVVDADELLAHGFEDSRALPEWTELTRDRGNFCGLPSVSVSGRYRIGDREFVGRTRYTVVHPLVDQYLIQVTATISATQWTSMGVELETWTDAVTVGDG